MIPFQTYSCISSAKEGLRSFLPWGIPCADDDKKFAREFTPVNHFLIGKGKGIEAVQETDGIEAVCADLGNEFREGIFIAHDGEGESNYKLVPWSAIQTILERRGD